MKKINLKINFIILSIILLISNISICSNAVTQTGSLNLVAIESTTKESVSNLTFDIYQIGIKNVQGNFEYSAGFENSNLDIDIFSEENINKIQEYAITND
jgi:hypothetical protein